MQSTERSAPASTLFQLLSEQDWELLRREMELTSFQPGDVLVTQGTMDPPFQVIVEGVASVVAATPYGERRELGRLGFGECVGEMSLLTGEPASADVIAGTAVQTYAATSARLAGLGSLRARLIEALSATLAGRLRNANERLLALHPARKHIIACGAADVRALELLPAAMARISSGRVLVLLAGDAIVSAAGAAQMTSEATVRVLDDGELRDLPRLMERMAHEFDEIILMGDSASLRQIAPEAASVISVVQERSGDYAREAIAGQALVIGNERWTAPALRRLQARLNAPVIGIIPPESASAVPRAPIAKLARVLTRRSVGVALGAGAAKGLAHLGVLRALDELDVPIDVVAGCSIGAPIAAGVAAGMTVDELTEHTARVAAKAVRPTLPLYSFLSNAGLKEELRKLGGERRIEDLDLPLAVVATDLYRRASVTFTTGPVWPRLLASMAIPGVYPPTAAMGSYLVDGSVLHPVPVQQCRELGAGLVIGVRLTGSRTSPREELDDKPRRRPLAIETILRSLEVMVNRLSEVSHLDADVNIEVCVEGGGGVRDFKRGDEIAATGYRTVMAASPELAAAMPYIKATEAA